MKIEIELDPVQRSELYRSMLEQQYKDTMSLPTTYDFTVSKEALLESLKNVIYWNSNETEYKEFLASISLENNNEN